MDATERNLSTHLNPADDVVLCVLYLSRFLPIADSVTDPSLVVNSVGSGTRSALRAHPWSCFLRDVRGLKYLQSTGFEEITIFLLCLSVIRGKLHSTQSKFH